MEHNIFKSTNFNGNKRTGAEEFIRHFETICDNVDWTGLEGLLLKTPADMFKGWDKSDNISYTVGNVFRRSVNGVSVKFITRVQATENYNEPWDAPECFTPIQYSTDTQLIPIVSEWVENEFLVRNCQRICPMDGKTYWYKFDFGISSVSPSVARAADPKEWGEVEVSEELS